MPVAITIVAQDAGVRERLAGLLPPDAYTATTCAPDEVSGDLPALFIVGLPALNSPEEQLIETLRADDATAEVPIVIASALPMIDLQSVPYASDWTIAIVEEPVEQRVLLDTMGFLLNPGNA